MVGVLGFLDCVWCLVWFVNSVGLLVSLFCFCLFSELLLIGCVDCLYVWGCLLGVVDVWCLLLFILLPALIIAVVFRIWCLC